MSSLPITKRVLCNECGAQERNMYWTPGTPCPRCGSSNFEPVVEIGKRSEYADADRTQGFAPEDIRLGRLAQWADLISAKQLQRILFQQGQMANSGEKVDDLATILLKEKVLTRKQVGLLHKARCVVPGNTEDIKFGIQVVKKGLATEDQVRDCIHIQQESDDTGSEAPPLPLVLHEKRLVKEGHILALLKAAELKGFGLLHRIHHGGPQFDGGAKDGNRIRTLLSLPAVQAPLAILIMMIALFIWLGAFSGAEPRVKVRCKFCGAETGKPANSVWPLKCDQPSCGKRGFAPIGMCQNCGHRILLDQGKAGNYKCSHCGSGSDKIKIISGDMDEEALRKEIEARNAKRLE
jgi:DNA-directed RNA polymerase subunit RPC12/RpoP